VNPSDLEKLRQCYGPLLDPGRSSSGSTGKVFDIVDELPERPELRADLQRMFEVQPLSDEIIVTVKGVALGVATRSRVCRPAGTAGVDSTEPTSLGLGSSGGATLPGFPAEFHTFPVACETCGAKFLRLHYDPRPLRNCTAHPKMPDTRPETFAIVGSAE
jgi:hypothetical protein